MQIIKPGFVIEDEIDGSLILRKIERAGRTCYKSEAKITGDSAAGFVRTLIAKGHESVLEHEKVTVRVICDRGVSHEIVRHRIGSYSQESTRYCNYGREGLGVTFIEPPFWSKCSIEYVLWRNAMQAAEGAYLELLDAGVSPQQARCVLPNSLKTEIVITYNLREWRHFFRVRTARAAHPQMREITVPMLAEFKRRIPVVFDDLNPEGEG